MTTAEDEQPSSEYHFTYNNIEIEKPEDFRFTSEDKDQRLKELFDELPYRLECPECRSIFYKSEITDRIQDVADYDSDLSSHHFLNSLESWRDLLYLECPDCGERVEFRKPRNRNQNNTKGVTSK